MIKLKTILEKSNIWKRFDKLQNLRTTAIDIETDMKDIARLIDKVLKNNCLKYDRRWDWLKGSSVRPRSDHGNILAFKWAQGLANFY